jgi:hypothetical protein
MNNNILDYIIIGGGIAGLYANYKLYGKSNGILLEKEHDFGGRVLEIDFHGHLIKLGAGIMAEHNKHLLKLLNKFNIKPHSFISGVTSLLGYSFDMTHAIKLIKKTWKAKPENLPVKKYLEKYLGKDFSNKFIENCEYRDFLNSDMDYFIYYYDINDMSHDQYKILMINWIDLIKKLIKPNCIADTTVINIKKINNIFYVKTNNKIYQTKKLIMATTLQPLDKLLKNVIDFKYSDYIGTVPFVRIYTWHKNSYNAPKLGHFNLVKNELQKIIKINKNILMASYSDNKEAKYWEKILLLPKNKQIKIVEQKLQEIGIKTKVDDIDSCFWKEGIHYYKPANIPINNLIKKLSRPSTNIYVIGEIISKKQGWVEGAIESVDRLIK